MLSGNGCALLCLCVIVVCLWSCGWHACFEPNQISCTYIVYQQEVYLFQGQILVYFFSQDPKFPLLLTRSTLGCLPFKALSLLKGCPLSSFMCSWSAKNPFSRNLRKLYTILSAKEPKENYIQSFFKKNGTQIFSHLQCFFLCQVVPFSRLP